VAAGGIGLAAGDAVDEGAPYVDAGLDQAVAVGDEVLLDGGGTWDDQGDITQKEWSIETPTGITIERFEDILQNTGYGALQKTLYFINPHYETKFGLKPRKQLSLISAIPYLRNFLITTCYYVVSPKDSSLASEKHSLLSYASA